MTDGRHAFTIDAMSAKRLWCAVLEAAISDLNLRKLDGNSLAERDQARALAWLSSADFREVCDLAGLDPGAVRSRLLAAARGKERISIYRGRPKPHQRDEFRNRSRSTITGASDAGFNQSRTVHDGDSAIR